MARAYHVDGPVLILTGTGAGSPPALEELGIADGGVDVFIAFSQAPVKSDAGGPMEAVDLQDMGQSATISFRLSDYDNAQLQKLRAAAMGSVTDGTAGAPGRLIFSSGGGYKVVLRSADEVWRFTTATLAGRQGGKLGTEAKKPQVEFKAIRHVPAGTNTASGIKLYDHTDAA